MPDCPSAKAEMALWGKTMQERSPAIAHAAHALRSVLGIGEGTSVQGNLEVRVWAVPDPPSPADPVSWAVRSFKVLATDWEPVMNVEGQDGEFGKDGDVMMMGEGGPVRDATPRPVPEIAVQFIDSAGGEHRLGAPATDMRGAQQGLIAQSRAAKAGNERQRPWTSWQPQFEQAVHQDKDVASSSNHSSTTETPAPPASPPYFWLTPEGTIRERGDKPPLYWSPHLSTTIINWIEQPGTKSKQVHLSRLELRSANQKQPLATFDATEYQKIKITQFNISPANPKAHEGPQVLNWLVLQVSSKAGAAFYDDRTYLTAEEKMAYPAWMPPACRGKSPYWVMAFPVEAVSGFEVKTGPESYVQGSFRTPRQELVGTTGGEGAQMTLLKLGTEGVLPVVHGLGVNKRFAESWMDVCAAGNALVRMESGEEVPLRYL